MAQVAIDELQTRVERLQTIADNLPAIIAYWDRDERCRFSNRASLDWFGLDPNAMLDRTMREVLGESLYQLNKRHVEGALRGEPQFFERNRVDTNGITRYTQTSYIPDLRQNRVQGFFVLISEITERKRAEVNALESRAQLQALLDAVPDYIMSIDREGKILFANRTVQRPIESMLGTAVHQYFPEPYRELAREAIEAAFAAGQSSTFESVVTMGENKRWYSCQVTPVLRDGETTSALLISRDLTERKQIELQLVASERLAAVGSLAAGVAHEINTPVQYVSDSVEFLRESHAGFMTVLDKLLELQRSGENSQLRQRLAEEAKRCIEEADLEYLVRNIPDAIDGSLQGLKRVTEIVRSLKAFSHLDQKELGEAQLGPLIDNALTLAAHEYKYVACVTRDYVDDLTVRCHVSSISQVVLNLVVNAAHAIAEKNADSAGLGEITIKTQDEDDNVLISIRDTGAGIPEHIRSRVFAPFFTTKPVGKGTGQGLAISWTIISEHHGTIWFESEVGEGTTFYIRLPKNPESRESLPDLRH